MKSYKLGTVNEIKVMGNNTKNMYIKMDDGSREMFFSSLPGFNKSLRVGDKVKVYYRSSIMGTVSSRATKIKGA